MSLSLDQIQRAVRNPRSIPPFVYSRYSAVKCRIQLRELERQKSLIHDFISNEEFLLIILDSCRYDYFEEEVSKYLEGYLHPVYTPVTATIQYVQYVWDGQYPITYVTGMPAPTNHAFERKGLQYRPEDHFEDFVHVWKFCNDKELGAVPPEVMSETILQQEQDKLVAHYVQPHAPYIGEYKLRKGDDDETWSESLQDIYRKIGRYDLREKEISDRKLRKAYRSNLQRVLRSVKSLVRYVDRPVVVTADHGELLGENNEYIHGGPQRTTLCKVPWFVIDEEQLGTESRDDGSTDANADEQIADEDVIEQLRDLGYV